MHRSHRTPFDVGPILGVLSVLARRSEVFVRGTPASEPAGVVGTRRNRQRAGTNRRQPIPTQAGLRSLLITAHWTIDHDAIVGLPAPRSWNNGIEADLDYDDASPSGPGLVVAVLASVLLA